ncbi:MAG: S-layer homology domain-containing protein [Eubacteriales bacterium]
MLLKQSDVGPKTKSIFYGLTLLIMMFSLICLVMPGLAVAAGTPATSLTVKLNNNTVATYSISDLQNMTQVTQGYSSIDSMPAPCMTAARGVKVTDILTNAGIDVSSVNNIIFKSTDGYSVQLTKQYLLNTVRYYYPNLTTNWDDANQKVGAGTLDGGVQVEPILALVSYYKRFDPAPGFNLMDNANALRLCFGQDPNNINEVTSNRFAKWVNEIDVDGNLLPETTVTLNLSKNNAAAGDSVTASGTASPNDWVPIKVLDSAQNVVVFDATKADANGNYSISFIIPGGSSGVLTVVAGSGSNVVSKTVTVTTTPAGDTTAPSWSSGSLTATSKSKTGLTLNWSGATDNVGVTGYKVYKGATQLTATPVTGTSYNVTGLSAGAQYTFKVEAVDAAGNQSTDGPSVTVTTTSSSSSGGGSSTTPQAVTSTTGAAIVTPSAGGTISLGSEVKVNVPAGALSGSDKVEVKIEKVNTPPVIPSGFKLAGSVYEFSVGGQSRYSFNKSVTLTFNFDPSVLVQDEIPAVYYYDEAQAKWINLGGTVSGFTITVQVDHFTKYAVMAAKKTAGVPVVTLTDITGHWAENSIKKLFALGAIGGYPDGSFKPDKSITRAEFVTILVKAFELSSEGGKVFADTANHWAKGSIAAAAFNGIVSGYDETTFGPDDLITREQMAAMIVKAAKLTADTAGTNFTDRASISSWASNAVATAVLNKIMNGYPDNTIRPKNNATRAEAVTVIVNVVK